MNRNAFSLFLPHRCGHVALCSALLLCAPLAGAQRDLTVSEAAARQAREAKKQADQANQRAAAAEERRAQETQSKNAEIRRLQDELDRIKKTGSTTVTQPNAPANSILTLKVADDVWVEVVDGKGRPQVQRVLKAGDVLDFSETPPYAVVIGRTDVVRVLVRGRLFDVGPHTRNSVARFEVK